jgi:4-amino-4-deoxychorismate lyase
MSAEGQIRDRNASDFKLIETLRWQPEDGFVRLDRHLERLKGSAQALGFRHRPQDIDAALASHVSGGEALRVRLTLDRDGTVEVTTQPFTALDPGTVWTLRIATTRLDASDPLLRHKTTLRATYAAARAEFLREEADEVLLLNHDGQLCEGTITTVFLDMGGAALVTPALSCGLLPGVLRGDIIDAGRASEAVVTPEALAAANEIFVGNSLRGLIRARLA